MSDEIPAYIEALIRAAAIGGIKALPADFDEHTAQYIESMHGLGIQSAMIVAAAKAHYKSVTRAKADAAHEPTEGERAFWKSLPKALKKTSVKSIQSTRLDFEGLFEDLQDDAKRGRLTRSQGITRLRNLIHGYSEQAARDGMASGGVSDELDAETKERVAAHAREQNQYIAPYIDHLINDTMGARSSVKPAMWFNGSIYPAFLIGLESASRNGLFMWVVNKAKESCKTCLALDGQIHRIKDYQRSGFLPRAAILLCTGRLCGCQLVPAFGQKARGRFPYGLVAKAIGFLSGHTHE